MCDICAFFVTSIRYFPSHLTRSTWSPWIPKPSRRAFKLNCRANYRPVQIRTPNSRTLQIRIEVDFLPRLPPHSRRLRQEWNSKISLCIPNPDPEQNQPVLATETSKAPAPEPETSKRALAEVYAVEDEDVGRRRVDHGGCVWCWFEKSPAIATPHKHVGSTRII